MREHLPRLLSKNPCLISKVIFMSYRVLIGDCYDTLDQLDDESVDTCVTSPPYFSLRDYGGEDKQIGLEETPEEYVENLVKVFRKVRQKLKPEGTLWLNLGDTYAGGGGASGHTEDTKNLGRTTKSYGATATGKRPIPNGLKPKDLIGIPWRVAFALQADGWWLRQDIVWAKPNPMPESVKDRCTRSHEFIFQLSKSKKYYYDHEAILEPIGESMKASIRNGPRKTEGYKHDEDTRMGKASGNHAFSRQESLDNIAKGRNKRDVWFISAKPYRGAHFAVYPPELIEPCILAGTSAHGCCADCGSPWRRVTKRRGTNQDDELEQKTEGLSNPKRGGQRVTSTGAVPSYAGSSSLTTGWEPTCECHSDLSLDERPIKRGVVLDPFGGSGTTAAVAIKNNRDAIICELNEEYVQLIDDRIASITGGFRQGQKTLMDY